MVFVSLFQDFFLVWVVLALMLFVVSSAGLPVECPKPVAFVVRLLLFRCSLRLWVVGASLEVFPLCLSVPFPSVSHISLAL